MTSTCERAQLALVAGDPASELRAHVDACEECGFFRTLSRNFSAAVAPAPGAPLGAAFAGVLAHALATGEPLAGRWRLEKRLGHGGQAEVFGSVDLDTGDRLALKILRAAGDEDSGGAEVAHARRVVHPNVCRVFHTERHGGVRLIVMELVEGPALASRLPAIRRGRRREALTMFARICDGVAAAHDAGVLHLDLKPQNILLRGGREPVITDFGLAQPIEAAAARGGTPAYMAPEQARGGAVDARADVYALGLLLRDMVGPRVLRHVVERATEHDPTRRFRNASELRAAALAPVRRRRRAARVAGALAGIAVAAAGLLLGLHAPAGPRAAWHRELWGEDTVDRAAWNVAANPAGTGLPRVVADPAWGCGQNAAELLDGLAQYPSWEHGWAFSPERDVCVDRSVYLPTGACGVPPTDGAPCRDGAGVITRGVTCGDRTATVELAAEAPVIALRAWYHDAENTPAVFRVEAETRAGWRTVYSTGQNLMGRRRRMHESGPHLFNSAPVTAQFLPVATRRVRLVLDSCSVSDEETGQRGHGWLYEIEVFARVSRWQAWRRRLFGS